MPTVSELPVATFMYHDDKMMIVREHESSLGDQNKQIDKETFDSAMKWTALWTGAYTAAPEAYTYSGGSFSAVSAWAANTAISANEYRKPTAQNGYIYECVARTGTNLTHATTEPTWPTTLGQRVVDNEITWECRGAYCLPMVDDLTAVIVPGMPLKYVYGSTSYYGICLGISATHLAVAGAPLVLGTSLTALYYGPTSRVVQVRFYKDGDYDGGVADIACDGEFIWVGPPAYLVHWYQKHKSSDGGASNPYVNLEINGSVVSTMGNSAAADKGYQPTTSFVAHSPVAIKTGNYDVVMGNVVNPTITVAGSNGDAAGLSICALFVLE